MLTNPPKNSGPTKSWSQEFWEYEQENSVKKAQSEEKLIDVLCVIIKASKLPTELNQMLHNYSQQAVDNGSIVLGGRIKAALK